jgi:hypothetical protein
VIASGTACKLPPDGMTIGAPEELLTFLQGLADALAVFTAGLERYRAAADLGDRHPRLALDHLLAVHRASLRWADDAIAALSAVPSGA